MPAGFEAEREREGGLMAKDEKVPDNKQCEEGKLPADRPRQRGQEVLPGILGKQLRAAYGELLNAPVPDALKVTWLAKVMPVIERDRPLVIMRRRTGTPAAPVQ